MFYVLYIGFVCNAIYNFLVILPMFDSSFQILLHDDIEAIIILWIFLTSLLVYSCTTKDTGKIVFLIVSF